MANKKPTTRKAPRGKVIPLGGDALATFSAVVGRAELMAKLGYQYGGDRDVYEALGYKDVLEYQDFWVQYKRQDMGKAVIDRPVQATWRGGVEVMEGGDDEDTALEKGYRELDQRLGLAAKFARLDRLTGLGKYGILLLGMSDAKNEQDLAKPVTGGGHRLLYVRPFGEGSATISEYESDPSNERYGQPKMYSVNIYNLGTMATSTVTVHHSRVIHVADGLLEGEIEGTPRLEVVYNRLKDLEKIVGGSAEMFWRGARPGYQGQVDPEFQLTPEMRDDLQDQMDEFEHNLRRLLINEGIEWKALAMQVASPKEHVDVIVQMISAVTGIPKRVLTGSERGELASTEDKSSWFEMIESRREEFAGPVIVRPFVDRCVEYGVLPPARSGDYSVRWQDLWATSDLDKAEVGDKRANALAKYASSPLAPSIVPPDAFMELFLGLDKDEVRLVAEMVEAQRREEEAEAAMEEPVEPPAPEEPVAPEEPEEPEGPEEE